MSVHRVTIEHVSEDGKTVHVTEGEVTYLQEDRRVETTLDFAGNVMNINQHTPIKMEIHAIRTSRYTKLAPRPPRPPAKSRWEGLMD